VNKVIKRDEQTANKIFDNRSLEKDYRTLVPILKEGLKVLDVGCGFQRVLRSELGHLAL
jgi:hypothetical protein